MDIRKFFGAAGGGGGKSKKKEESEKVEKEEEQQQQGGEGGGGGKKKKAAGTTTTSTTPIKPPSSSSPGKASPAGQKVRKKLSTPADTPEKKEEEQGGGVLDLTGSPAPRGGTRRSGRESLKTTSKYFDPEEAATPTSPPSSASKRARPSAASKAAAAAASSPEPTPPPSNKKSKKPEPRKTEEPKKTDKTPAEKTPTSQKKSGSGGGKGASEVGGKTATTPTPTPTTPGSPPTKRARKSEGAQEKKDPDWMPTLREEKDLKFTLQAESTGFTGVAPGGDPPNRGTKGPPPRGRDACLEGLTFVISGTLDSLTREECADLVKRHGGRMTTGVSGKTDFLIVGADCGHSKYNAAKKNGAKTRLLDEDMLFDILRASASSSDTPAATPMEVDAKPHKPAPPPTTTTTSSSAPVWPPVRKSASATTASAAAASATPSVIPKPLGPSSQAPPSSSASVQPRPAPPLPAAAAAGGGGGGGSKSSAPGQLWVSKYRPRTPQELIGNQEKVRQLQTWLREWHQVHSTSSSSAAGGANKKKGGGGGAGKDAPKKAVLLSGPPGIGKTSSATIIAEALGFSAIEVNASDTRGKAERDVEGGIAGKRANSIRELVTNRSLSLTGQPQCQQARKQVLIMDEVDGMHGSGERGGVAELIDMIKISKMPVICICNDAYNPKVKSLQTHCLDLKFNRPTKTQVAKRMMEVARKEGLQVDEVTLETLVEQCSNDIRWVLNSLQMRRKASQRLAFDDVKQGVAGSKDLDMSPFNVCDLLLQPQANLKSINDRINLMFQDADIMPLFIQENYPNMRPTQAGNDESKRMDLLSEAADAISLGDLANTKVRAQQKWSLMPFTNFASVQAASLMCGRRENFEVWERGFHRFPGWLGKNSSVTKGKRILGELHTHTMQASFSTANRQALRQSYLSVLRDATTRPLRTKDAEKAKAEGIPQVMEVMNAYGLTKEDWDGIQELTKFKGKHAMFSDPTSDIATAVKSALTRECNKDTRKVHSADGQIKGMKKSKKRKKGDGEDVLDGLEDDAEEEDDEDEEEKEKARATKLSKLAASKLARINFEGVDDGKNSKQKTAGGSGGTKGNSGRGKSKAKPKK